MAPSHCLLLLNAALSLYNCGVIWQAQRVSFPLFGEVAPEDFAAYHGLYERRIRPVVILPGNLGGLAALALVFFRPEAVPLWAALAGLALVVVAAVLTFAREIPDHRRLQKHGNSDEGVRDLVRHNRPRVLAVAAHAVVSLLMVAAALPPVS